MSQTWYDVVAGGQSRLQRIRAALASGGPLAPDPQSALDTIILAMRSYLMRRASRLQSGGEDALDEALLQIVEQQRKGAPSRAGSSLGVSSRAWAGGTSASASLAAPPDVRASLVRREATSHPRTATHGAQHEDQPRP